MIPAPAKTVFDVLTDFLASDPSPEEVFAFSLPNELQARAEDLLELNAEGELSFDEEREMFDYMRVDLIMGLLKAKTHLKLEGKKDGS
jgi:hypothetical protein